MAVLGRVVDDKKSNTFITQVVLRNIDDSLEPVTDRYRNSGKMHERIIPENHVIVGVHGIMRNPENEHRRICALSFILAES